MNTSQITIMLGQIRAGDKSQLDEIYALLYKDIKAVAGNQLNLLNTGETISATVLANECYLKMLKTKNLPDTDRRHFMQYLAKSMRSFLLDTLRSKNSIKRGGQLLDTNVSQYIGANDVDIRLMDIDRMLDLVEQVDHQLAEILQYKLIFNMTYKEIGEVIEKSERQVIRLWQQAKALLLAMMKTQDRDQ